MAHPTRLRALRAILALALACTTALALPSIAAAATGGPCITPGTQEHFFTGDDYLQGTVDGVKAQIDPAGGYFYPCSETSSNAGSSAWVAIVEQNDGDGTFTAGLIQVGITMCGDLSGNPPVCGSGATPHYFMQKEGCFFPGTLTNLGVADWNVHTYEVNQKSGTNDIEVRIDGVLKYTLPSADTNYYCWANEPTGANWLAERWDRGDSLGGNSGLQDLSWTSMQYRLNGGSFVTYSPGTCDFTQPTSGTGRSFCSGTGSGWMNQYTTY